MYAYWERLPDAVIFSRKSSMRMGFVIIFRPNLSFMKEISEYSKRDMHM